MRVDWIALDNYKQMKKEIRTFVAIKIQPGQKLLKQVSSFKEQFKDDRINWVSDDNLHLTLRFIGNTTREQLYTLVDALEVFVESCSPFSFELKGCGYFNGKGKPRVLFVKVKELEQLKQMAEGIEKCVVSCGFQNELKPFRPHLTLGRIKYLENRNRFIAVMDEMEVISYQHVEVSEFILYQSILSTEGPSYKRIKTFEIK